MQALDGVFDLMFLDELALVSDVLLSFGLNFSSFSTMYFLGSLLGLGDIHYFTFVPFVCEDVVHVHKFVGVKRSPVSLTCCSVVVIRLFLLV